MAFKDLLLTLTSYPDPAPASAVKDAVSVAAALGAHLAAISCEVHVEVPGHFLAGKIANIPGLVAAEAAKSRKNANDLLDTFDAAAKKAGVSHEMILEKCATYKVPSRLVGYARVRDLTIMPASESDDQWHSEELIFESGRPALILPAAPLARPFELESVVVAWDFSRTAARAVADALPLLETARKVRVVTVVNEKSLDTRTSNEELARNLARHGIEVVADNVDAAGRSIGDVLEAYALSYKADMLVMGAYGHSKWREIVLGGATKSLLSNPPIPILLSH